MEETTKTLISDWIPTDLHQKSPETVKERTTALRDGKVGSDYNVYYDNGVTGKDVIGEVVEVKYEEGVTYVKILLYIYKAELYALKIDKLPPMISFPINLCV